MPYHLMTDEFIRDRLAAGEAQRLATTPVEVVQYDGARWTRAGDVWVLEDSAQGRLTLTRSDSTGSGADLAVPDDAPGKAEPRRTRSAAKAELPAAALPVGPYAAGMAGRRGRRIWVVTSAACVAALTVAALAAATRGDRTQSAAFRPAGTPLPSVLETTVDGTDRPGPTGPRLVLPPAAPSERTGRSEPTARRTRLSVEPPLPTTRPPSVPVPSSPPVKPPPPAPTPVPSPQPGTPQAAVNDLGNTVNLVWQAEHLSTKGRAELLTGVDKIKKAISDGKSEKQIRKQINRMLRKKSEIRNRGELTEEGEDLIEQSVDRLKSTL